MSSVRPPSHMTSGWRMSTARFSINFRNPYLDKSAQAQLVRRDSLRVLVFTGGELDVRQSLLELDVSVKVVWVETLFPPVDVDSGLLHRLQLVNTNPIQRSRGCSP